jgi:hypothetical protein
MSKNSLGIAIVILVLAIAYIGSQAAHRECELGDSQACYSQEHDGSFR